MAKMTTFWAGLERMRPDTSYLGFCCFQRLVSLYICPAEPVAQNYLQIVVCIKSEMSVLPQVTPKCTPKHVLVAKTYEKRAFFQKTWRKFCHFFGKSFKNKNTRNPNPNPNPN